MIALLATMAALSPAAVVAREHDIEPELLLAIAYVESRNVPTVVSRVRGREFCGVMQTRAENHEHCAELADVETSYRAGATILRAWLRITRGDLAKALDGYGCGHAGVRSGCRRFAQRVLGHRDRLRREASS